jgi:hypothetical protein
VGRVIADLPEGTEVHLLLRVLSRPDPEGWHDPMDRLPDPGVFVTVKTANATFTGRIVDDLWRGEADAVVFSPVIAWREIS